MNYTHTCTRLVCGFQVIYCFPWFWPSLNEYHDAWRFLRCSRHLIIYYQIYLCVHSPLTCSILRTCLNFAWFWFICSFLIITRTSGEHSPRDLLVLWSVLLVMGLLGQSIMTSTSTLWYSWVYTMTYCRYSDPLW